MAIVSSLVISKILLELVTSHRDGFYIIEYSDDYGYFLLKHTADRLNTTFHPTDLEMLKSIEEIPDFVIDMHRRQCISDLLLDWLLDTTFKNDDNNKQPANQK